MNNSNDQDPKQPREWLYVGNFISQQGSKYTMLNGPDIGPDKVWLVEKSAFDKVVAERDALRDDCQKFMAGVIKVGQERDKLREALGCFIRIDEASKGGKALISNQGQGMDGYTKLANYDSCVNKARKALEPAAGDSDG